MKKPSLLQRIKKMFKHDAAVTVAVAPAPKSVTTASSEAPVATAEHVGFRSGAEITFITPIGAYAGSITEDELRDRAVKSFMKMDIPRTMTMN